METQNESAPARKQEEAPNPAAKKAPVKKKPVAKQPAAKKAPVKKPASLETIGQKYDALIDEIAEYEVERRRLRKHANFYTRHRRQVEIMARSFKKFSSR